MTDDRGAVTSVPLESTARLLAPIKARSYEQLRLGPGVRVADIGCGPGLDVAQLARLIWEGGEVTGVDVDPAMLEQARRLPAEGAPMRFELGSASALPFADGTLDGCRSDRLFQHLEDPAAVLAELERVTRLGGRVVVLDTDWGSLSLDAGNTALERKLACFKAETAVKNGFAGRQLPALFARRGLQEVSVEVLPLQSTDYATVRLACGFDDLERRALEAGVLSAAELKAWDAGLKEADAAGQFFGLVCLVLVAGTVG